MNNNISIKNQLIPLQKFSIYNNNLAIKREDLLHPHISGNKFRKLNYNIIKANELGKETLLTFGGAFSNHIAAVAAAGKEFGFKTIGIIRGEELIDKVDSNPTLLFAQECGMEFHFVTREEYRKRNQLEFIESLKIKYSNFYLIPEGGTNEFAIKGCKEILTDNDKEFDYVCASVGTGGTIAGIIESSNTNQAIIGFSALKGAFQNSEINKYTKKPNYKIIDDYCFGGYAKVTLELIDFINEFKEKTNIQLDPIYTGKMVFGILDLMKKGYFKKGSSILAIHTGGLQGIKGMNDFLIKKNLPIIR